MQILKRTFAAAAAVTLVAAAAQAQSKDFSGQWEMNAAKSDFGPMAGQGPSKITMTVTQSTTTVKVAQAMSTPQGDLNQSTDYTLDGKEATSNGADGQPVTSSAKLDGDALVINSKLSRQGMDITRVSHWTLSPDGKSLTVSQDLVTPMGAMSMKLVFDKK